MIFSSITGSNSQPLTISTYLYGFSSCSLNYQTTKQPRLLQNFEAQLTYSFCSSIKMKNTGTLHMTKEYLIRKFYCWLQYLTIKATSHIPSTATFNHHRLKRCKSSLETKLHRTRTEGDEKTQTYLIICTNLTLLTLSEGTWFNFRYLINGSKASDCLWFNSRLHKS